MLDFETVEVALTKTHSLRLFWGAVESVSFKADASREAAQGGKRASPRASKFKHGASQRHKDQVPGTERVPFLTADARQGGHCAVPHSACFDQMPVIVHWGSSDRFLKALLARKVCAVLFGHVHA